jgi:hypothetical protein
LRERVGVRGKSRDDPALESEEFLAQRGLVFFLGGLDDTALFILFAPKTGAKL